MKRFEGLNTPVIFVQNVVTDLLLGLKLHAVFAEFDATSRSGTAPRRDSSP